jgi:hypothetical protein
MIAAKTVSFRFVCIMLFCFSFYFHFVVVVDVVCGVIIFLLIN